MGQDEYRLKSLADDELLAGLSCIVQRRNQVTAEFLAYLAELDERQIFLERGFSSLFEYCVEKLGLCESTAGRHIAAARVCRNHPQVFAMVASGALHASALSLMKKHVTQENAQELFDLCAHRSARKTEELLAARFPRPDVRDLVRRLPAQVRLTPDVGCDSAKTNAEAPRAPTNTEASRAPIPGQPPGSPSETSPSETSPSETSPSETSPSETSPSETSPSEAPLNPKPFSSWKRKRHYAPEVVREVFGRDGKQCTYVSPDGRRCCSRRCLELDHVDPWAEGGEETVCNLRLRCRAHNQWYARQYFGRARVDAAVRRSRAARAQRC